VSRSGIRTGRADDPAGHEPDPSLPGEFSEPLSCVVVAGLSSELDPPLSSAEHTIRTRMTVPTATGRPGGGVRPPTVQEYVPSWSS
jgi:hypothetical protein